MTDLKVVSLCVCLWVMACIAPADKRTHRHMHTVIQKLFWFMLLHERHCVQSLSSQQPEGKQTGLEPLQTSAALTNFRQTSPE